jgi:hypothetical protein
MRSTSLAGLILLVAVHIAAAEVTVTVDEKTVTVPSLVGLGYNANGVDADNQTWQSVFVKRLKEGNPQGYTRIFCDLDFMPQPDQRDWDSPGMKRLIQLLSLLKEIDNDAYLTMVYWGKRPDWMGKGIIRNPETLRQFAVAQADFLEHLVIKNGLTNVKHWCVTNELSSGVEGDNFDKIEVREKDGKKEYVPVNMPHFEAHHRAVYEELKKRGLETKVHLLATDALGRVDAWRGTVPFAVEKMDAVTGVYGIHDYAHGGDWYMPHPDNGSWTKFGNETGNDWLSPKYYDQVLLRFRYGVGMVKSTKKPMMLAEFGGPGRSKDVPNGRFDQGESGAPYGILLAERVCAGLNAGFAGMNKWHLNDFRHAYGSWIYQNRWGSWGEGKDGYPVKPDYFAYALLTRHFRKGAQILKTSSSDPLLRTLAAKNLDGGLTVLVINRKPEPVTLNVHLNGDASTSLRTRKYVFIPTTSIQSVNGDLPTASGVIQAEDGTLKDQIAAESFALYVSGFDETPPAAVKSVQVTRDGEMNKLTWAPSKEKDLCYYRIYRSEQPNAKPVRENQIASTAAASFTDAATQGRAAHYAVTAVDAHGNEGPARE